MAGGHKKENPVMKPNYAPGKDKVPRSGCEGVTDKTDKAWL